MQIIPKIWGWEEIIVNNELYCAKYLIIKKGYQTSIHYHNVKDETFYVVEGVVELLVGKDTDDPAIVIPESIWLQAGETCRLKPGIRHRIVASLGDIKILEISTHHEDSDSIRLQDGGRIDL